MQKIILKKNIKRIFKTYKELIILSREEKGNISYHLYQDINDDSHFTFIEEWQNQAIDEHNQTKHFTTIVPQIKSFASKPSRAIKYKEVQ
ncbi:MAG: putative quinol monooxygenase [Faecalibacillus faecis]